MILYKMTESALEQETQRFIGRVKWFNNKNGYGFVEYESGDIFVHHSSLQVPQDQFKYLVEGEYVEFTAVERTGEEHDNNEETNPRITANDVTGPQRGPLMCQTRNERREKYSGQESPRQDARKNNNRQNHKNVKVGSSEWKLVGKKQRNKKTD